MTEYKRWVPVILFSTFLLVCYTLSLRYKTEPFFSESAVSPFSLPGSGLQISYEENECLNDISWTSNDITCADLSSSDPRCNFVDVNGFSGFEKCPRACGNCQDQLFPGDSMNSTMESAPDALYDGESGEMVGEISQYRGNMTLVNDKRLYEVNEELSQRIDDLEDNIEDMIDGVYDDVMLGIVSQDKQYASQIKKLNPYDGIIDKTSTIYPNISDGGFTNGKSDYHGFNSKYNFTGVDGVSDPVVDKIFTSAAVLTDTTAYDNLTFMYNDKYLNFGAREFNDPQDITDVCISAEVNVEWLDGGNTLGTGATDLGNDFGLETIISGDAVIQRHAEEGENEDCRRGYLLYGTLGALNDRSGEPGGSCFDRYEPILDDDPTNGTDKYIFPTDDGSGMEIFTDVLVTGETGGTTLQATQSDLTDDTCNFKKCINASRHPKFKLYKWVSGDDDKGAMIPISDDTDENNEPINCYNLGKDLQTYIGEELNGDNSQSIYTEYTPDITTPTIYDKEKRWMTLYERCPIRTNNYCKGLTVSLLREAATTIAAPDVVGTLTTVPEDYSIEDEGPNSDNDNFDYLSNISNDPQKGLLNKMKEYTTKFTDPDAGN